MSSSSNHGEDESNGARSFPPGSTKKADDDSKDDTDDVIRKLPQATSKVATDTGEGAAMTADAPSSHSESSTEAAADNSITVSGDILRHQPGVIERERALMLDCTSTNPPTSIDPLSLHQQHSRHLFLPSEGTASANEKPQQQQREGNNNRARSDMETAYAARFKEEGDEDGDDEEEQEDSEKDSGGDGDEEEVQEEDWSYENDDLGAKREYNRVCAAKSRAKRKKTLTGLHDKVDEVSTTYRGLQDKNRAIREKLGALFQDTLSGLLGNSGAAPGGAQAAGTASATIPFAQLGPQAVALPGGGGGQQPSKDVDSHVLETVIRIQGSTSSQQVPGTGLSGSALDGQQWQGRDDNGEQRRQEGDKKPRAEKRNG